MNSEMSSMKKAIVHIEKQNHTDNREQFIASILQHCVWELA